MNKNLHILFILFIGGIGVQTFTSCSSDDGGGDNCPDPSISGDSMSCGGKKYKTVVIGTQTWMAENLNYAASGSKCGDGRNLSDKNTASCNTYGRLYDWETAKTVCPSGWHLPSDAEWKTLTDYVGSNAGTKLKSTSGWNDSWNGTSGNGTDDYGFSALPGGDADSDGSFGNVGDHGSWWSSTENDSEDAWYRSMNYYDGNVDRDDNDKPTLYSVRCIKG